MPQELKTITVNLKSLGQDIVDPIVQGGGDANGRTFRIIFTQEAADMFTPETKVYLKWRHIQLNIRGYNVFTHVQGDGTNCFVSPIWEIHWPKAMLHEGDVMCCIEIVDEISIAPSNNFTVHVLADPDDGSNFVVSDDYTLFQDCVISMNSLSEKMEEMIEKNQEQMDRWTDDMDDFMTKANCALHKANVAVDLAQEAINQAHCVGSAQGVFMNEY